MVRRLILIFLGLSLIPVGSFVLTVLRVHDQFEAQFASGLDGQAVAALDKIDRNLFERYGDVQAFGVNAVIQEKTNWYQVGSRSNKIVEVMNQYMYLYGVYNLMIAVDREGKVIAVNDKDAAGKTLATEYIYRQNFKNTEWFRNAVAGKGLDSEILKGTWVDDVYVDTGVKKVYGNDGLAIGFSAPFHDASGNVIGVWTNKTGMGLVEQIFQETYTFAFKERGFLGTEMTLLDGQGQVLIDYDPMVSGSTEVHHNMDLLLKLNLVEKEVEIAKQAVMAGPGKSGSLKSFHTRKQEMQVGGYAKSDGALGYAGLKWSMLIRLSPKDVGAVLSKTLWPTYVTLAICIVVVLIAAYWIAGSIVRPIDEANHEMVHIAKEVSEAVTQLTNSSTTLADGASEQAASLEETSASLEELSSMTRQNAENAQGAKELASQARISVDKGIDEMRSLQGALKEIQASGHNISKIIKTIDEIAFQTNILALNAAVEAARAGEHGLGFAVVADEVRNLAQRSASAAKETATLIEGAVHNTQHGAQLGEKVATDLEEMGEHVRKVDSLVAEIALASDEQSKGVSQITTAVTQMDKVTQSSAATSEETASAARQLSGQVDSLTHVVRDFAKMVEGASDLVDHSVVVDRVATTPAVAAQNRRPGSPLPLSGIKSGNRAYSPKKSASLNDEFFVDHH